ncbi:unnamed protein product [Protopolystoma xenopodis]|uniref:Uncharacterized protein n=1 Tax=Protopolystoma xenopodis TaxID=117903 RepID=A0A448WB41_9PLAT|nr:unnamed protein product [Protopolystoma xenopodis]
MKLPPDFHVPSHWSSERFEAEISKHLAWPLPLKSSKPPLKSTASIDSHLWVDDYLCSQESENFSTNTIYNYSYYDEENHEEDLEEKKTDDKRRKGSIYPVAVFVYATNSCCLSTKYTLDEAETIDFRSLPIRASSSSLDLIAWLCGLEVDVDESGIGRIHMTSNEQSIEIGSTSFQGITNPALIAFSRLLLHEMCLFWRV